MSGLFCKCGIELRIAPDPRLDDIDVWHDETLIIYILDRQVKDFSSKYLAQLIVHKLCKSLPERMREFPQNFSSECGFEWDYEIV